MESHHTSNPLTEHLLAKTTVSLASDDKIPVRANRHGHQPTVKSVFSNLSAYTRANPINTTDATRQTQTSARLKTIIEYICDNRFRFASAILGAGTAVSALTLLKDHDMPEDVRDAIPTLPDILLKAALIGFVLPDIKRLNSPDTRISGVFSMLASTSTLLGTSLAIAKAAKADIHPGLANAVSELGIAGIGASLTFKLQEKKAPRIHALPALMGSVLACAASGISLYSTRPDVVDDSHLNHLSDILTPAAFVGIVGSILFFVAMNAYKAPTSSNSAMTLSLSASEILLCTGVVLSTLEFNPNLILILLGVATTMVAGVEYALHKPEPVEKYSEIAQSSPTPLGAGAADLSHDQRLMLAEQGLSSDNETGRPRENSEASPSTRLFGTTARSQRDAQNKNEIAPEPPETLLV